METMVNGNKLELFVEEIDKMRREALSSNPTKFAAICNYFGIPPDEDVESYEIGQMDPDYTIEFNKLDKKYARIQFQKPEPVDRPKIASEHIVKKTSRNDIWIPTSAAGFRQGIRDFCNNQNIKLPRGVSRMKKPQLRTTYLKLRKVI